MGKWYAAHEMSVIAEVARADLPSPAEIAAGRPSVSANGAHAVQAVANRRVVMLVANEFTHDTRVYKQARSLCQWGCEVHVIAMARPDLPVMERLEGLCIHRLEVRSSRIWRLALAMACWSCKPLLKRMIKPADLSRRAGPGERLRKNKLSSESASSRKNVQSPIISATKLAISDRSAVWRQLRFVAIVVRRTQWHVNRFIKNTFLSLPARIVRRIIPGVTGLLGLNYDMARQALSLRPTIVQSHDLNTLLAGVIIKRLAGIKLVYDSHELFLERNIASKSRWRDRLAWTPIERFCIGKCDVVMSVAEGICLHLAKRYRIAKPHLLRNVQPYEPPPQRTRILSNELGIDHAKSIVIYPGAITINRGLEAMIDSAPLLEDAVYVVMGYARNPKYLAQLKDRAQRLGVLNAKVYFREAVPIDQVVRYTASADLGIVPTQNVCLSYFFEASNKIFHCLMAGVPLAMSDHHEKRLIVEQFGVGVLFDETDPRQIAGAVNSALADRPRYDQMRSNCLNAARELNWEREEHGLRTIFAKLLGGCALPIPPAELPDTPFLREPKLNGSHRISVSSADARHFSATSVFDDAPSLRELCQAPADPRSEPASNFPLGYYEEFLKQIQRLDIEVITFADLFRHSDDWDYRSNYANEYKHWRRHIRNPQKRYLVIQHDVDNHPQFTKRMVAMEALHGVRSNIFIFHKRFSIRRENPRYEIDHAFFEQAEQRGFVIGYHQNALQLAGFDLAQAQQRFRDDVAGLRNRYNVEFMVPHGGVGREIAGRVHHNIDLPMPSEYEHPSGRLRWVFNRYGPRFALRWSDGGLRKLRDPAKLANLDIIESFLKRIEPGSRAWCLVHPQRWGFNVDPQQNPALARQAWYEAVCHRHNTISSQEVIQDQHHHA